MAFGGSETGVALSFTVTWRSISAVISNIQGFHNHFASGEQKRKNKRMVILKKMMIAKVADIVAYPQSALFVPHKTGSGKWSSINEKPKQTDPGSNECSPERNVKWPDSRNMLASGTV